jgi:hypothetical protein
LAISLPAIGVLMGSFDENDPLAKSQLSAFTQALAGLGWADGRNVRIDLRWAGGDINRIRALAQELVALQPDIILASTTPATIALQGETRTIPIVFVTAIDPVASGLVPRLDRPTGNITGFATLEVSLAGKWLELLSEIAPGLKRAAIMFNPDTAPVSAYMPSFETAARSLKVVATIAPVHSDIDAANRHPNAPPPPAPTTPSLDLSFMQDLDLMTEELAIAKREGIACIVDAGHPDMGRDVSALRQLSLRSGIAIVVGGGFYAQPFYPREISTMSEDQLVQALIAQAEADPIGAFGEIGSWDYITKDERKVFRAVGRAP